MPYVVWLDGIGWRNDKVKEDIAGMDVPWDIFWESQAYRGQVGILDDRRDALSMPMQRDAMRTGARPDLNTEDAALDRAARRATLGQLGADLQPEGRDHRLPDAARGQDGAAPLVVGRPAQRPRSTTCRRACPPTCSRSGARDENGVVQNDFFCIGRSAKSPALAHTFINFMLDEKIAYTNFVDFIGYTPPQNGIDAEALLKRGLIPKSLEGAVVRPDQFAANQELLQLSVAGQRLWDDAWSKFKAG